MWLVRVYQSQEAPTTGEASRSPKWRMHTFIASSVVNVADALLLWVTVTLPSHFEMQ